MSSGEFRRGRWAYVGFAIVLVGFTLLTFRSRLPVPTKDLGLGLVMMVGVGALFAVGELLMRFKGPDGKD